MKVDQRCQAQTTSRLFGEDVGDIVEVVTYNAKNIYVLFSRGGVESTVIERRQQQLSRMADFLPLITFSVFYL